MVVSVSREIAVESPLANLEKNSLGNVPCFIRPQIPSLQLYVAGYYQRGKFPQSHLGNWTIFTGLRDEAGLLPNWIRTSLSELKRLRTEPGGFYM